MIAALSEALGSEPFHRAYVIELKDTETSGSYPNIMTFHLQCLDTDET